MKLLLTLPAANIYDKQGRAAGHRHTPASREELKKLQALAPRLHELGVTRIICSDLDGQSGAALARRLNVPAEEWQSLRRFNIGKLHGVPSTKAKEVRTKITDNIVPIRGGDSLASFEKRIAASAQRIQKLEESCLLLADAEVIEAMTGANSIERYHLYEAELGEPHKAETMAATANGRCVK